MPNQTPDRTPDQTPGQTPDETPSAAAPTPRSPAGAPRTTPDLIAHHAVPIRIPGTAFRSRNESDAGSGTPAESETQLSDPDLVVGLDLDLALVAGRRAGSESESDPELARTVEAGPSFDAVSVPMDLGLDALDLLLRGGSRVGPVAADSRCQVRRVGFLLDPGTLEHARGFAWWCREHGMRTLTHGAVLALPRTESMIPSRLLWLVPPGCGRTDPAALLACLRRAVRDAGHPPRCQASVC